MRERRSSWGLARWPIASTRLPITNLQDVIGQLNGYLQDRVGRGQPIYRMRLAHSAENISLTRMTRKFVNVPNCFLFSRQRKIYFGITCRKTLRHVVLIKAFSRREIILCVYNGLKSVISWHFTTKFGRNRRKSFKHAKRGNLPRAPTPGNSAWTFRALRVLVICNRSSITDFPWTTVSCLLRLKELQSIALNTTEDINNNSSELKVTNITKIYAKSQNFNRLKIRIKQTESQPFRASLAG